MRICIKRIYDDPSQFDGTRVLIDRLWPRGVSKKRAAIDLWAKDLAPSTDMRQSFGHTKEGFNTLSRQYVKQLRAHAADVDAFLKQIDRRRRLTLLYGAKDPEVNHAVVLQHVLENWSQAQGRKRRRPRLPPAPVSGKRWER